MKIYQPRGDRPMRIAVLISGTGRSLKNLLDRIAAGGLRAQVCLVVSSAAGAKGLQYAEQGGIASVVLAPKDFATREAYSEAIFHRARAAEIDLVVMAGFLKQLAIPLDFAHRVVNIHPGLIPAFCGKGFYGHHVHEAALAYGVKLSGCTVHLVDNEYDHGPVILQMAVPVLDDDTPDTLAARIFEKECEAYPAALELIAEGRASIEGRLVRIAGS
jgi:formyltetrahydrofolate-dependent phosphoribosylglycinamide formyltransferase